MKGTDLDSLFGGAGGTLDLPTVAVLDDDEDESAMAAFEVEVKPVQKSRQQIISEGIDRSPMASVQEIRAKFSKQSAPVFPKQHGAEKRPSKLTVAAAAAVPAAAVIHEAPVEAPVEAAPAEEAPPMEEEAPPVEEEPKVAAAAIAAGVAAGAAAGAAGAAAAAPPPAAAAGGPSVLSKDEFLQIAKVHGCEDAIAYFAKPRKIRILIKPQQSAGSGAPVVIKEMELQFLEEQRLLIMVRKAASRYIRLHDVYRVDGRDNTLTFVDSEVFKKHIQGKTALSLFFATTQFPMVILLESPHERDLLIKLIMFLHKLLATQAELEVYA